MGDEGDVQAGAGSLEGVPPEGGLLRADSQALGPRAGEHRAVAPGEPDALSDTAAAALARRLESAYEEALARLTSHATALALAAAEAVVRGTVASDEEVVEAALRAALEQLAGQSALEVRVNPADGEAARRLCAMLARAPRPEVVEDEEIARGGCVVRTDFGDMDASLDSQIRRLREALGEGA